jgi:flagellar protein FlbD
MIHVTHLDHTGFVLNSDLIEQIETTPDTVITLTNGHKLTVLEMPHEIVELVRAFRRSLQEDPAALTSARTAAGGWHKNHG